MTRYFVTGAAGFIGSSLCDVLLRNGHEVVGFDNFSTGFEKFIADARANARFRIVKGDLLDPPALRSAMSGCDFVFHLAANADVRFGTDHPDRDLQQNTIGTFNVLEAMRLAGIGNIAFSSTGSVYGEPAIFPTPENAPFPVQTSLYAAAKVAGEALISAYCEGFGMRGWIFRFVSVLGERYTHGHVFDFLKKLLRDSNELAVLGDGHQKKSYIYIGDCVAAMLHAIDKATGKVNIFNLGQDNYVEVNESIRLITRHLGYDPRLIYGGGERGWIGDSPFIFLDTAKIRSLGWTPQVPISDAIVRTLEWLNANRWVLEARD